MNTISNVWAIVEQFSLPSQVKEIQPFGTGNINSTYRVKTDQPDGVYILQKINGSVFSEPRKIMGNLSVLTHYFLGQKENFISDHRTYQMPELINSKSGRSFVENNNHIWRMMSFISNTYAVDSIQNVQQAGEIGKILGIFHRWTAKLNLTLLHDTLPGFHITPSYLEAYDKAKIDPKISFQSDSLQDLIPFIEKYRSRSDVLERAVNRGDISLRVMHGDPKISNILFDNDTDQGVAIIDLDTVKPGLIHYDIGDCLRSSCNRQGEETEVLESVEFDISLCREILNSYAKEAGRSLTKSDTYYLYDATFLMIYELTLRFLTDFFQGNIYFKVIHPLQNLNRALVQMKLAESLERQKEAFYDLVSKLTISK